jgi:hypothetical protein
MPGDVAGYGYDLVGIGLVMLSISSVVLTAMFKLGRKPEACVGDEQLIELRRLVCRVESAANGIQVVRDDVESFMEMLKDVRRHILSIELKAGNGVK